MGKTLQTENKIIKSGKSPNSKGIYDRKKNCTIGIVTVNDGKFRNVHICVGTSIKDASNSVVKYIKKGLKDGHEISWNHGKSKITMWNDKEYSDVYEEHSKYVTTYTVTSSKLRSIRHNERTIRNPKYADNPECGMCYKTTTKVYDDHLENDDKTPVKVCASCRKVLKVAHEMFAEVVN